LQVTIILFLLNTTLAMAVLDLISLTHVASFVFYDTQVVEIFHILLLFSIIIRIGDGSLQILITLVFFNIYFNSVASSSFH
jgi:hypothetical protein